MIIFQVRRYNIIGLELDSIERRLNKRLVYLTIRQQAKLSKYEYDILLELCYSATISDNLNRWIHCFC